MINGIIGSNGLNPRSFDPGEKGEEIHPPPELSVVSEPEIRTVEEPPRSQEASKNRLDTFA